MMKKKELTTEENIEELSQKIFGKPSSEIKYLLVTNYIHQQLLEEELARTGLYQWINVFNGEVRKPRDVVNYNDYDIVQVNMSAQDVNLVSTIREQLGEDSKTKLVLNNDYTTEIWGMTFDFPETLGREISKADMLFGTEYFQTTALSEVSRRKCYVIPHPCDVKRFKHLPSLPIKNLITTIWRRYDNFAYIPSLAVRNHGLTTQLIGYDDKKDPKTFLTTTLYDYVFAGTNCFEFNDQLRESLIVYNPFTFHSYDRTTVECAAMGVAVVGSSRTQSMNVCYPHTVCDPYDVKAARDLIDKLLTDTEFYKKVVATARIKAEFYNHENSKERYLLALDDALNVGRERRATVKKKELEKGTGDDVDIIQSKRLNRENVKPKIERKS